MSRFLSTKIAADIKIRKRPLGEWSPESDPAAIRTRDRLLRRQMLYPAELPDLPQSHMYILLSGAISRTAKSALQCKVNKNFLLRQLHFSTSLINLRKPP